jgi:hypothetical protein
VAAPPAGDAAVAGDGADPGVDVPDEQAENAINPSAREVGSTATPNLVDRIMVLTLHSQW